MTGARTPFRRILVANRGEIAVRILRSARAAGLSTVAVYSDADAGAPHVRMADLAVRLGPAPAAESYLSIDRIIAAARASGAGAVHPGYGFLAERADFATACADAGLVFVGPSAGAIRQMGDKAGAKARMAAAGVPCVPGYDGADQTGSRLAREAEAIGWPVMIKAVAGGGGRGMRQVAEAGDFAEALTAARSEAESAFGDGRVLLEKAIDRPRHIEIQVMADRHGNVIHLGERDCSVQRRHQKVVEEAPSPAVSPELRAAMGAAAVRAARGIGYEGAGTLEFLLDGRGNWYFMEMNTRLQVEHPVTEAVTGLDLVALQLRVAMGEPLGIAQEDVQMTGHAIEVRLCAEAPEQGFLPQAGRLDRWAPSAAIRVDHGLESGALVPPDYDSMIAKLIAHGDTRAAARGALLRGLAETQALGLRTNQAFLHACLSHPEFAAGAATTDFVAAHEAVLLPDRSEAVAEAVTLVAAVLCAAPNTGLTHGFPVPVRLEAGGVIHDRRVRALPGGVCQVEAGRDGTPVDLRVLRAAEGRIAYRRDGCDRQATVLRAGGRVLAHIDGAAWAFSDLSRAPLRGAEAEAGDGKVRAAMAGRVVAVPVTPGAQVAPGQGVAVLEAMKMEHIHRAAIAGTVQAIHVAPGDQAVAGKVLIEIEE